MRLIVGGGRAAESSESRGSVIVGVRTLSEGGRVGNFSREQVLLHAFLFRRKILLYVILIHLVASSC